MRYILSVGHPGTFMTWGQIRTATVWQPCSGVKTNRAGVWSTYFVWTHAFQVDFSVRNIKYSLTNFKIHATRKGHFFSPHVRNNYPAPAIHNRQTHYVDHVQIYYARVVEFASYMCKLVHSDPGLGKSISQSSARFLKGRTSVHSVLIDNRCNCWV